ncbi:hypothetical protein [Bradyrhizobium sp. SZCCHNS3052]|uniref:hypothetical protein n=1 Tax=Bradyrhizobium sp. SZCCHNS3052 TaxID=3057321 RepID=UPI002916F669|nr:hypothetical protein [Bradyrhizobium sp. SZCCHNS3052]
MPKSLKIGPSLEFATITLAKKHFDPFRTGGELNQDVPPDQFSQLKLLYERYCANTDFLLPSTVAAFFPTMVKRNKGYTRCLGVRFADGTSKTFSLDKALSAVASAD